MSLVDVMTGLQTWNSYIGNRDLVRILDRGLSAQSRTFRLGAETGNVAAGLFSNNQDLANRILRAGQEAGEKFWQLPLFPEYRDQIKSEMADIKNTGGRPGGPSAPRPRRKRGRRR